MNEEALREFVGYAIDVAFAGGDLDGIDIQDKAHELGLIEQVPYNPSIHGENDEFEPGDMIYVKVEGL